MGGFVVQVDRDKGSSKDGDAGGRGTDSNKLIYGGCVSRFGQGTIYKERADNTFISVWI